MPLEPAGMLLGIFLCRSTSMSPHFPCMYIIHTNPVLICAFKVYSGVIGTNIVVWPELFVHLLLCWKKYHLKFCQRSLFLCFLFLPSFSPAGRISFQKAFFNMLSFWFHRSLAVLKRRDKRWHFFQQHSTTSLTTLACLLVFGASFVTAKRVRSNKHFLSQTLCILEILFLAEEGNHVKRPNLIAQQRKKEKAMK